MKTGKDVPGFSAMTAGLGPLGRSLLHHQSKKLLVRFMAKGTGLCCLAGAALLFLAGGWILWLIAHLEPESQDEASRPSGTGFSVPFFPMDRNDGVSLALVILVFLSLFFSRSRFIPLPPDDYYHLAAARHLLETGSVPLWSTWEFAPIGRPHLYPPGFHWLIALCARWTGDNILDGFRIVQSLLLPLSLAGFWYFTRRLFGSAHALAMLLLLGMDVSFMAAGYLALPFLLAGALTAVAVAEWVSGRILVPALFLSAAFYIHIGAPVLELAAAGVFALFHRRLWLPALLIILLCGELLLPWYTHVWYFRHWFCHPIDAGVWGHFPPLLVPLVKLLWMQVINIPFLFLAAWAMRHRLDWHDNRVRLAAMMALVPLPLLFSYGGRYWLQTLPYWTLLAAGVLAPALRSPLWKKRAAGIMLPLAVPAILLITGMGNGAHPLLVPCISGWWLPPVGGFFGRSLLDDGRRAGAPGWSDAVQAGEFIRARTRPGQIIHLDAANYRQWSAILGFHANRPIDTAVWEEVRPPQWELRILSWQREHDSTGIYVVSAGTFVSMAIPPETQAISRGEFTFYLPSESPGAATSTSP